jgi:hypothetical protein
MVAVDSVRRIGLPEWLPLLLPRLSDEDADVVTRALVAFETIARPSDHALLAGLSRDRWELDHYNACISWILSQRKRSPLTHDERENPRPAIVTNDTMFLAAIAREAAVSFESAREQEAAQYDAEADFNQWERWSQVVQALDRLSMSVVVERVPSEAVPVDVNRRSCGGMIRTPHGEALGHLG